MSSDDDLKKWDKVRFRNAPKEFIMFVLGVETNQNESSGILCGWIDDYDLRWNRFMFPKYLLEAIPS